MTDSFRMTDSFKHYDLSIHLTYYDIGNKSWNIFQHMSFMVCINTIWFYINKFRPIDWNSLTLNHILIFFNKPLMLNNNSQKAEKYTWKSSLMLHGCEFNCQSDIGITQPPTPLPLIKVVTTGNEFNKQVEICQMKIFIWLHTTA